MRTKPTVASIVTAATLLTATAFAGTTVSITGSGTATDGDKSVARKDAEEQAITQANATCIGKVTSTVRTVDSCIEVGKGDAKKFICTAMVRATCELPAGKK